MQPQELESVERRLTGALTAWAVASVLVGGVLALLGRRADRAGLLQFGRQTAGWGVVDGAIAGIGTLVRRRRGPLDEAQSTKQARSLRNLLLVNAAADVGYVAGGVAIAARARSGRASARLGAGDGLAMIVQGVFLFILDVTHARRVR